MARTRLCNLWSRRQLLVTFLESQPGSGCFCLLPTSQATQSLSHTRISKLGQSFSVVAKQPLAAEESCDPGSVQQMSGGRSLPSGSVDDLESTRLRAWSRISQAGPALSGSVLPLPLAAQMCYVRRSGTRAAAGQAPASAATKEKTDELATARFVRVLAVLVVIAVGATTLPKLGQSTSGHAVTLLTSPKPFWQKSGAARIRSLASSTSATHHMLQLGVAPKLVAALTAAPPPDVAREILYAMHAIAEVQEGKKALQEAGASAILQRVSKHSSESTEQEAAALVLYHLAQ